MSEPISNSDKNPSTDETHEIAPAAIQAAHWFVEQAKKSFGNNLSSATIYGPAVTQIFDVREHHIHALLVLSCRDVDQLLELAKHSIQAARNRIAPPLVITEDAIKQSCDVFPLEWLDISQFHRTLLGNQVVTEMSLDAKMIRLQCERELRSLDIHLQQGILASGGDANRVRRLEDDSADSLVRVLRGIHWLSGDRQGLLPSELITHCVQITKIELSGCGEAIKVGRRHDMHVLKSMLLEIAALCRWIDVHDLGTT